MAQKSPIRSVAIIGTGPAGAIAIDAFAHEAALKQIRVLERREGAGGCWEIPNQDQDHYHDYWWQEHFDALVIATGHYSLPYIPHIPRLREFAAAQPGSVLHTKAFRDAERFRGMRVLTVGAPVSAAGAAVSLINTAKDPIYASVRSERGLPHESSLNGADLASGR
ncbi:uncharacterized protein BDV17DRAFT_290546 [Aspergillus undulatus]|uniref:uncharacterized protein n=1 Tax=Aspergillus undulatus TaxID=1810928 RepID=UPI003CCCF5A7